MVANRVLVTVVLCGVLFAPEPARADDQKPTELKNLAVIPVTIIGADEAVDLLKKRFGYTEIVRMPLFNAILVYGTPEEVFDIRWLLRPL